MKYSKWLAILSILLFVVPCPSQSGTIQKERPASWAEPMTAKGLPNLHKVSDTLYRCAQPERKGMATLKSLGVKTIVNLRANHSDKKMLNDCGCGYKAIPMNTWNPEEKHVVEFLKTVSDPSNLPVLIHCQHGADRTGTMCAVYRIVIQGWTKEEAIREMTEGGYGFHSVWGNLPVWIRNLDIEAIKVKAGLTAQPLPKKPAEVTKS